MEKYLIPLFFLLLGCHCDDEKVTDRPEKPIVIIYENDVHCAVDGYAQLVALRDQQRALTPYVTTVSCGDFVQGDLVGSISSGESIVEIMNQVGYDVVTLGNHEFDFGMSQMFRNMEALDASVVSANFRDTRTDELLFPAYRTIRYGEVDIAYLGLTTTTTMTSVSPLTFWDEAGNVIYDFSLSDFYDRAQKQIDKARSEGADYVVVLSHLGDSDKGGHPSSVQLIARTTGVDVVLDGHDHHVLADTLVRNLEGTSVLLTSTGTKFDNVGVLTLSTDGTFSSRLESGNSNLLVDADMQRFVDDIKEKAMAAGERVIGTAEVHLTISDASGNRLVRKQETNIGNLCADAFRTILNVDVAMINGGGIRSDIPEGDITYNHLLAVFPFNNTACTATLTGQQLVDALEFSVSFLPVEDGSFMQVSGVKFEVDPTVPTPVIVDENDLFAGVGDGKRRVSGVQVWDADTRAYQPVDLNRKYTLGSFDYQIKELGCAGIFRYTELLEDNLGQDVEVLASFIQGILDGRVGMEYAAPEGRILLQSF